MGQLTTKSQESGQRLLQANDHFEISAYGGAITPEGRAVAVKKIKDTFPNLTGGFHDVLAQRVTELKISDTRFNDAVNYVIDNCVYPTPTIANFISYDKKIKLYNYPQFQKLNDEMHMQAGKYYKAVRIEGLDKPMYASNKDILEFNLELWAV